MKLSEGDTWNALSDSAKKELTSMHNLFCYLNLHVQLADSTASRVSVAESECFDGHEPIHYYITFRKIQSCIAAVHLVQTFCKLFSRGADEKNVPKSPSLISVLNACAYNNDSNSLPLERYRHNRVVILFSHLSGVCFISNKIQEYLNYEVINKLKQSAKHDLQVVECFAGIKVLALVSVS